MTAHEIAQALRRAGFNPIRIGGTVCVPMLLVRRNDLCRIVDVDKDLWYKHPEMGYWCIDGADAGPDASRLRLARDLISGIAIAADALLELEPSPARESYLYDGVEKIRDIAVEARRLLDGERTEEKS